MRWLILLALATACPGGEKQAATPDAAPAKPAPPPAPPDAPPPPKAATVVMLKIAPDGKVQLNDQPVSDAALPDAVRAALAADPDASFSIEADKGVKHGRSLEVIDLLKKAGASRIRLEVP